MWALPGVALCVLSYGLIKSVNSIIVSWLLFYLVEIDLASEAFSIVMMWAASVFIGGIICAIVNRSYRKEIFIAELFCAAVLFLFLKEFHRQASDKIIALIIVVCGLCYGGPYNLISTAIPIILGSQKGVENLPRAKSAIISLMEGFGQLMCGISLLFVPEIGVMNIHLVGSVYCGAAALLLLGEVVREHFANRSLRPSEKPLVPA